MVTAVRRSGHVCLEIHMPTPEYQRGHGTQAPMDTTRFGGRGCNAAISRGRSAPCLVAPRTGVPWPQRYSAVAMLAGNSHAHAGVPAWAWHP